MEKEKNLETILETGRKPVRSKVKEWLCRYGPAELICTATAYAGYFLAKKLTDNEIAAAYAATMGENIGFYGTMFIKEAVNDAKTAEKEGKRYGVKSALKTIAKLATEFGPAEVLDSLVMRTAAMGFGAKFLGKELGILAGKIAANVTFYAPAIASYEIRKYITARSMHNIK